MKHSVIIFLILIMGASASTSYAEEKNIEAIEKHWLEYKIHALHLVFQP